MPTINPENPLLSRNQIAAALGLTGSYLAHAAMRNEGPPFLKIGRTVRYDRMAVSEWLASNAGPKAA